jgi:hypothetical protein
MNEPGQRDTSPVVEHAAGRSIADLLDMRGPAVAGWWLPTEDLDRIRMLLRRHGVPVEDADAIVRWLPGWR